VDSNLAQDRLPRVRELLRRAFNNFLTSGYPPEESPEFLRRLRTLHLTGLVLVAFGLLWAISFAVYGAFDICLILLAMTCAYVAALLALRWCRCPTLVSHLMLALLTAGVVLSNFVTGGLVHANEVAFFVVPVLAVFLLGAQGLIWAGVVAACMGVFSWLHLSGYTFVNLIPEESHLSDAALTWVTALMVVAGVAFLYDRARRRMAGRILEAKERAEDASRAKTQFLANMSHEFRTPLNAVIGLTDVTLKGELTPEQRRHLEMVKASALSLVALVEDVLDVSRIEAGRLNLRIEPFAPRVLVEEVIEQFRFQAEEKRLDLEVELTDDLPKLVRGDAGRMRQVLANLVDNALKFTDQGRVQVRLGRNDAGGLELVVEDTGIGIPADLQQRVFESFSQADASASRRHKGSGLGLAICAELVEMMAGRIAVTSRPGRGSRFEVCLPLEEVPAASRARKPFRVLAAEDDRLGRELLVTILEGAGYRVEVVGNGAEAVEAIERGPFDLILMDIQMPHMDGLEAVRRIRTREGEGARTPIVALTAHALAEERQRCFEAGMDDFIAKPIEPDRLLGLLEHWLQTQDPPPACSSG